MNRTIVVKRMIEYLNEIDECYLLDVLKIAYAYKVKCQKSKNSTEQEDCIADCFLNNKLTK